MLDPATVTAIALKTSLLVAAAGLAAAVLARQSAARRHLLWAAALALSLLMPVAVAWLPSSVRVSLPMGAAEPWLRDVPTWIAADARPADAEPTISGPRRDDLAASPRETRAAWPVPLIVWLVGALAVLLHSALAHVGLMRWLRESRAELSPAWAETLRAAALDTGLRRRVRVLESDRATGPCTFGLLRPVVLLPAAGAGWPEAQRRFALLHELAHVRRLDALTKQLASLACALHWYNPLVWLAAHQARRLQEQACDDAVLGAGTTPSDYAQFLVGLARGTRRASPAFPAAVGMLQRSQLHGRVTAILDGTRARLPLNGFARIAALAPLAGLTLFLAALTGTARPAATGAAIPLAAPFSAVELRNGGHVSLVHGPTQTVNLVQGVAEQASFAIREGRLVIDRCPAKCPANRDFEVEVVTPALGAIAVAEGGAIQVRDGFPAQPEIDVRVSQGGIIDIRALEAARVTATVDNGGQIFATPATSLEADIEQGGMVTYWGDVFVDSSIREGGVVVAGEASDAERPLAELLGPQYVEPPEPVAPVPPMPPVAPIPSTAR